MEQNDSTTQKETAMVFKFQTQLDDMENALQGNQAAIGALKKRRAQLNKRKFAVSIAQNFQQGGVTRQLSAWYVNDNGKLDQRPMPGSRE